MEPRFVDTDPQSEIFFRTLPGKNSVAILKLRNIGRKKVAYKIKTTNPKTYIVKPNQGVLLPGTKVDVEFTLQTQEMGAAVTAAGSDKFMIQAIEVDDNYETARFADLVGELQKKNMVQSIKVKAIINKEGTSSYASNFGTPDRPLSSFASPQTRPRMTAPADELNTNRSSVAQDRGFSSTYGGEQNGLFHSVAGSKSGMSGSLGSPSPNLDYRKEYDKLIAKVDEQEKMLFKYSEERNQFFIELTNLRESNVKNKKPEESGFQPWQMILVAIIGIVVGAFLSAV